MMRHNKSKIVQNRYGYNYESASLSTAGARCTIFPKLCMVIELVEGSEKKDVIHFLIQRVVFPTGCTEKFGLIDRRFLVTCEANHIKFEILMYDSWAPKILEIGPGSRPCGATLYQKVEIFDIWGRIPNPCSDSGEILHSQADPCARRPYQV